MLSEKSWTYFYELYEDLPRQGPGEGESTRRALKLLPPLSEQQRILDIGCGAGVQTLDLARATAARIVAVDNHAPFIAQLVKNAAAQGLEGRITAQLGDMGALPFPDGSFDVLWSEGSIFILGFTQGLALWRRLLRPGGYLAVSEMCWLRDDVPTELREYLNAEGADICDISVRREAVAAHGYRLVGDFMLPYAGWWDNYCVPLAAALERFCARHPGDPDAQAVADRSRYEIEQYRKYQAYYSYAFIVMQRVD